MSVHANRWIATSKHWKTVLSRKPQTSKLCALHSASKLSGASFCPRIYGFGATNQILHCENNAKPWITVLTLEYQAPALDSSCKWLIITLTHNHHQFRPAIKVLQIVWSSKDKCPCSYMCHSQTLPLLDFRWNGRMHSGRPECNVSLAAITIHK